MTIQGFGSPFSNFGGPGGFGGLGGAGGPGGPNPQQGAEMFKRLDQDGSGDLDRQELEKMAEHISQMTGQPVSADDLLKAADSDQDGKVSGQELKSAHQARMQQGWGDASSFQSGEGLPGGLTKDHLEKMAQHLSQATGQEITSDQLHDRITSGQGGGLAGEAQQRLHQHLRDFSLRR